jgi:hypothetical protein
VVEGLFWWGFCGFWVGRAWFLDGKSWWIRGESVVGRYSFSGSEKNASFLNISVEFFWRVV